MNLPPLVLLISVSFLPAATAAPADAPDPAHRTVAIRTPHEPIVPRASARRSGAGEDAEKSTPESRARIAVAPDAPRSHQVARNDTTAVPVRRALDLRPPDMGSVRAVQSLGVSSADADDLGAVTIAAGPTPLTTESGTAVPSTGLGALYWAARHPRVAWRVLLPVVPHEEATSAEESESVCILVSERATGSSPCHHG
jgi:hypothetical protein